MVEANRRLGRYENRYGEMVEHMVKPALVKGFNELGFEVTRAGQNFKIFDAKNNIFTEVDYILEDGDKVIVVEAKSKLTTEDVTDHVERMQKVKAHADLRGDKRIYLGAIAGLIINDNERDFALKNGFYVIQPSGDAFAITVPEGTYAPKEW
jgi:predicted AAA+ superfamily ATPase